MTIHTKLPMEQNLLQILFDKVDEFIEINYDGAKYLVLFGLEKYNAPYDSIRYLI